MSMQGLKDSIPPHNAEAEQALLGALLLDWSSMSEVALLLRNEQFYSIQNQIIYKALHTLYGQSVKGDTLTLINQLTKDGNLDKAGGAAYVAELTNIVPSAANVLYYAQIVVDCYHRRELIRIASEMHMSAFDETRESKALIEDAEKKIFSLAQNNETSVIHNMHHVIMNTMDIIEKRSNTKSDYTGIPSGFEYLDSMTSGFQDSELIIIGARPSMGKTALALSMMEYISIQKRIPCGFFSLEMSYQAIGQRFLSQYSGIPGNKLRSPIFLQVSDHKRLNDAAGVWYDAPLFIVDTPNMRLLEIRSIARRLVSDNGVKIIFIDYIGLITTEDESAPIFERVAEISKSLKALARELNIPIVALSQVSRDAEGREPNLAQIRGSGAVEQDADVVMFIDRERKTGDSEKQDAKIIVAKQRNGDTGTVELVFIPSCTKFENKKNQ